MGHRTQRLLAEAARFFAVGGAATAVSFVLFNGLVHGLLAFDGPMHDHPLAAFVIANTVGMVVSYRGSRSWAFRDRTAVGAAGGRVRFFAINLASMAIPLACLSVTRYVLGLDSPLADNIAANVVGLGLGTLARFWAIKRFIFSGPAHLGPSSLPGAAATPLVPPAVRQH